MPPWSYCMPGINCLDEHKGASLPCKSICFLSCAEIIPEHHLTAPEGPLEQRQLETCCGNQWHWIAPKPLFKRLFGMNWDWVVDWKSNSLAVASSAGSWCLCSPCPSPTQEKQGGHRTAAKTSTSSLPLLPTQIKNLCISQSQISVCTSYCVLHSWSAKK